jgi:hypothetical protein
VALALDAARLCYAAVITQVYNLETAWFCTSGVSGSARYNSIETSEVYRGMNLICLELCPEPTLPPCLASNECALTLHALKLVSISLALTVPYCNDTYP